MSTKSKPTKKPATEEHIPLSVNLKQYFSALIKEIFTLDQGVDKVATIKEIKSKQSMSGANAWMLFCSIMIASIGLNLDSQAVIIGAMLISPLMSPILGIGLGVAINDKDALNHALMHFGAAIFIALFASTVYFWLTPLNEFTPQIEARTEPTFLDVAIAIFGGIAGIISIARKDISTTLPGVAIATALMPPLCVAGYGLANGSIEIASKAFYLFFLNSFFVAFTTFAIIRSMNFPHKEYETKRERRKNILFITFFSILMLVPSVLIFKSVYKEYNEGQMLQQFISNTFKGEAINYVDGYKLIPPENPTELVLKVYGNYINDEQIENYKKELVNVGLNYITNIQIISTSEIDLDNFDQLKTQLSGLDEKLNAQIDQLVEEREVREVMIDEFKNHNDFFAQDSTKFKQVCDEIKIFYPDIKEITLAVSQSSDFKMQQHKIPTAIISWAKPSKTDLDKLSNFIKSNYKLDTLKVVLVR